MASWLFHDIVNNDAILSEQIKTVIDRKELPQWSFEPFDIIVLDEFQDCTELLFSLINCFIVANEQKKGGKSARLVVLGDERQSIYQFRGADQRYLTLAPEILGPLSPYSFARNALSQSFRISEQTARFINHAFLGGESYITSSKPGVKPIVMRYYPRNKYTLAKELSTLIKHYGARNSAILAPSILKNGPLKRVTNILSRKYHIPIAVPIDDEAPLHEKVTDGKMCLSTIHQFKGSERDLIILFGLDSSFFSYFGRDLPDDSCPNQAFVALTRAAKQLVLVHEDNKKLMPFVSVDAVYETAEVVNLTRNQAKLAPPDTPGRPLEPGLKLPLSSGVRDMARHVRDESLDEIIRSELCTRELAPRLSEDKHIDMKNVVRSDPKRGFYEAVSDINGLVVVAAFEHDLAGTLNTLALGQDIIGATPRVCTQQ
ncbi:hypothetical protein G7Z17_g812 [Cylindrodendrum hubeiense]|uniref:UvrD-like helicase ATP-binding domain-containing protein n=1 Tax=Cylindrodendrum hubeiense TaxID=595255 RepID=A0A9P5HH55_9HYPO|nr:hypothetical protein G7Z17_g812 [Cylindrodendrum hubeiense]